MRPAELLVTADDAPKVTVRDGGPADSEQVTDLFVRTRAHISGSRRPQVFRALMADTALPDPRVVATVAECDHKIVAAHLTIAGDAPRYWRTMIYRHPSAAAALAGHRVKKLPARVLRRRAARVQTERPKGAYNAVHESLVDNPRLQVPALGPNDPGPHIGDSGPTIALGLMLVLDREYRGRGISEGVFRHNLGQLQALGLDRYDCSFRPSDAAAARMHLSMPFDVYRYPTGFFGTLDLHHPDLHTPHRP